MFQPKILVVDDENHISALIVEGLNFDGDYQIEIASNGKEALEKYQQFLPDLVVMDMEMPVMDGYESSSMIKSFDPNAQILVLTGGSIDYRGKKILSEGIALTLLKKPIKLKILNQYVREILSKHRN